MNKRLVTAFTQAKLYLDCTGEETSKHEYICNALDAAVSNGKISLAICWEAQDVILDRIAPYHSAESWAITHIREAEVLNAGQREDRVLLCKKLQKWRAAWLDSLIKEFS